MRIRIFPTPHAVARALAADISRAMVRDPALVLGLPTGRTPIPLYRELSRLGQSGAIDFSRATTFNLDEFLGVSGDDRRSYRGFMQQHLFAHVNMRASRIHFLNGMTSDAAAECHRYERAIRHAGGIDLQILGLGQNGHIGFNEPGRALRARTHRTRLTPATRAANATLFGGRTRDVPREALSMGMVTILHAARIVMLATGASKARRVERMINGALTTRLPASFLQMHQHVEVWLDRAAAARLEPETTA
ncbi:MAG TPA: glucosamine-6-phosphate deaminase [Vicinamibacterales bacterium]|jgi:glucosamine-6-phosphate deaminase|nr:glucosamine-6-phosphate deaminase [Vicinamibacterales bacterium]